MKVFILGAPDPEMAEIERVVREEGHEVRYALLRGSRVLAMNAYEADGIKPSLPVGAELIFVECGVLGLVPHHIADHHREGDPGFGKPPAQYMSASSLGQVLAYLGLTPTEEQRVIAAADHCPTQAYKGECPGVSPEALATWRSSSRAARRGVSIEEMEVAIQKARIVLETSEVVEFHGEKIAWVNSRDGEIPEASARFGIPFMYLDTSHYRTKLGIMGASPLVIAAWMDECQLSRVYGDPARGYAGGYC